MLPEKQELIALTDIPSGSCPLMPSGPLPWHAMSTSPSSASTMLNNFEHWNGSIWSSATAFHSSQHFPISSCRHQHAARSMDLHRYAPLPFRSNAGRLRASQLWCWVAPKWDFLRVATFYGPVWVVITMTFTIYIWAGKEIFAKRRQLRNFSNAASDAAFPVIQNPFISPFVSVKTTEIRITSELADLPGKNASTHSFALNESGRIVSTQSFNPYSVSIGAGATPEVTSPQSSTFPLSSTSMRFGPDKNSRQLKAAREANEAAFNYCKCALLFFASLLITWVPSSVNRVYSLARPEASPFSLLFASALVLPLQGFWNAIVYIATSLPACKATSSQILDYWAPQRRIKSSSPYPPSSKPKRSMGSIADSMKAFPYTGLRETS